MWTPRLPVSVLVLLGLLGFSLRGAEIGPFTGPEADAEAARLYERAKDYVNNVTEGKYSYAYIQFYWKRSGANVDRILTEYPSSPTAAQFRAGAIAVGPFTPLYFKERVLPRLEEKKVAAFDAVNCAIFLYGLEANKDEAARQELLASIVQTLCRQSRWSEIMAFPVLESQVAWLWNEVIRQAAVYHNDKLVAELLKNIKLADRPMLVATVAESLAFRGDTPADLEKFLAAEGNSPALRASAFAGLVRRERRIQQALAFRRPLKGLYDGVDGIQKVDQRADLPAFLATIPTGPDHDRAVEAYAHLLASLGNLPKAKEMVPAAASASLAIDYAGYLVAREEYQQASELADDPTLPAALQTEFRLRLVELLARAGQEQLAAGLVGRLPADQQPEAAYRQFHGAMHSTERQLVVREHTFQELQLTDPNLTGRLICEWSLTPNRTLRGAAPWDAVVFKFAPGFENLPAPKDKKKIEAAGR